MDTSSDVREESCESVVVGTGMAGLMAATTLSDRDVVVLEAAGRAGERVESVRQGDYWINLGTQFTEGTGTLIEALERHQIPMGTLAGKKVALALNGKQVDTSNPFGLMLRSRMTFMDRVGLAAVGARILAAVPFLAMNPDNALAKRVRALLDARSASYVLRGVRSEVARIMVRPGPGSGGDANRRRRRLPSSRSRWESSSRIRRRFRTSPCRQEETRPSPTSSPPTSATGCD
ncbi:FAD-dependent oxidoreductase [Streptomyces sp. NPDC057743]|uniref:FAD-dependent oxidoreductase n=1 Tax=Streptomyces sp. NPDC057743 TaxID=3346236 RepID=UPI0036C80D64